MTSVAEVTTTPRILFTEHAQSGSKWIQCEIRQSTYAQRVTGMVSEMMLVQTTVRGLFAYRVKSGILSARVAFPAIADVIAEKNTTAVGVDPVLLPCSKMGPKP